MFIRGFWNTYVFDSTYWNAVLASKKYSSHATTANDVLRIVELAIDLDFYAAQSSNR